MICTNRAGHSCDKRGHDAERVLPYHRDAL